jgi:hypothetical protein
MIDLFESFGSESSMSKMMLTVTFLELHMGDVVRAENTYLNCHLNNSVYIKCKECEVADLYVLAFKRQDITKLDEAKSHTQINYLDKEIQSIARNLSLFRTKPGYSVPDDTNYNKAAEQISRDMSNLMKSTTKYPDIAQESTSVSTDRNETVIVNNEDVDEFSEDIVPQTSAPEENFDDDEIDLS